MNTEERLANLEALLPLVERELAHVKRRNRRVLIAALVAAGVTLVAASWIGTPGKVLAENGAKAAHLVSANIFILEDANGKCRAMLSAFEDGPMLRLLDENSKTRVSLRLFKDGPGLGLYDENGKPRALLEAFKDGPGLGLADENGKTRASLSVSKDGPALGLADENGRTRAALNALKKGPALTLSDENRTRARLGVATIGTEDGRTITHPESCLLLFGPDGKGTWQAP
jgi:hypothetical protein